MEMILVYRLAKSAIWRSSHGGPSLFPNHPNPVPRIPTQIIESITVGCCLLGVLSRFREITAKWGEGAVGAMMIGSYAFIRFFDEYLRADFRGHSPISGLSPSQFLSIVVLTLASLFSLSVRALVQKPNKNPPRSKSLRDFKRDLTTRFLDKNNDKYKI